MSEIWDTKKCARIVNRVSKDAYGTKHPFTGYLGQHCPEVAEGFKVVYVDTWGFRLVEDVK